MVHARCNEPLYITLDLEQCWRVWFCTLDETTSKEKVSIYFRLLCRKCCGDPGLLLFFHLKAVVEIQQQIVLVLQYVDDDLADGEGSEKPLSPGDWKEARPFGTLDLPLTVALQRKDAA